MRLKKRNIEELHPADYNPRKISDEEYEKLKTSIKEFGFVAPIIYNITTDRVVGGHQRLRVLKDLGHTETSVIEVELSEEKEKALNIALNKITGEWDLPKLKEIFEDLGDLEFDLGLTGFDPREIDKLIRKLYSPEFEGGVHPEVEGEDVVPVSTVKMLQLFFNEETHPEFLAKVEALKEYYGTETVTDTVEKAVNEEFKTKIRST